MTNSTMANDLFGRQMSNQPSANISFELLTPALLDEAQALACAHFDEVNAGVEPRRQFALDCGMMLQLSRLGALRAYTVRVGAERQLAGYITWNVSYDVESNGLFIAQQGAWYVEPIARSYGFGLELFKFSINDLRFRGVQCVFPHHRLQGRAGERLGVFFERLGAKRIQVDYCLWIGDQTAPSLVTPKESSSDA